MSTTITIHKLGEAEINANGRIVTVPIISISHDSDIRDVITQALQTLGVPVVVPSIARVPRPRNSRVWAVAQL